MHGVVVFVVLAGKHCGFVVGLVERVLFAVSVRFARAQRERGGRGVAVPVNDFGTLDSRIYCSASMFRLGV